MRVLRLFIPRCQICALSPYATRYVIQSIHHIDDPEINRVRLQITLRVMDSSIACKRIFTLCNNEECREIILKLKVIRISSEYLQWILVVSGKTGGTHTIVGWGTMLQAGMSWVRFPMRSLDYFNWPNPSSHTTVLGSTQPLTEISTTNLLRFKGQSARKADNLTAICEPIV
jgi:hypothetical protein